ncbi:hypothetical protein VTO42DRAFT_989 [Malbranchea cinnamomea]
MLSDLRSWFCFGFSLLRLRPFFIDKLCLFPRLSLGLAWMNRGSILRELGHQKISNAFRQYPSSQGSKKSPSRREAKCVHNTREAVNHTIDLEADPGVLGEPSRPPSRDSLVSLLSYIERNERKTGQAQGCEASTRGNSANEKTRCEASNEKNGHRNKLEDGGKRPTRRRRSTTLSQHRDCDGNVEKRQGTPMEAPEEWCLYRTPPNTYHRVSPWNLRESQRPYTMIPQSLSGSQPSPDPRADISSPEIVKSIGIPSSGSDPFGGVIPGNLETEPTGAFEDQGVFPHCNSTEDRRPRPTPLTAGGDRETQIPQQRSPCAVYNVHKRVQRVIERTENMAQMLRQFRDKREDITSWETGRKAGQCTNGGPSGRQEPISQQKGTGEENADGKHPRRDWVTNLEPPHRGPQNRESLYEVDKELFRPLRKDRLYQFCKQNLGKELSSPASEMTFTPLEEKSQLEKPALAFYNAEPSSQLTTGRRLQRPPPKIHISGKGRLFSNQDFTFSSNNAAQECLFTPSEAHLPMSGQLKRGNAAEEHPVSLPEPARRGHSRLGCWLFTHNPEDPFSLESTMQLDQRSGRRIADSLNQAGGSKKGLTTPPPIPPRSVHRNRGSDCTQIFLQNFPNTSLDRGDDLPALHPIPQGFFHNPAWPQGQKPSQCAPKATSPGLPNLCR